MWILWVRSTVLNLLLATIIVCIYLNQIATFFSKPRNDDYSSLRHCESSSILTNLLAGDLQIWHLKSFANFPQTFISANATKIFFHIFHLFTLLLQISVFHSRVNRNRAHRRNDPLRGCGRDDRTLRLGYIEVCFQGTSLPRYPFHPKRHHII